MVKAATKRKIKVVRLDDPATRRRVLRNEIAAGKAKIVRIQQELETCSLDVLCSPKGDQMGAELERLGAQVRDAEARAWRLDHDLPEVEPEREREAQPVVTRGEALRPPADFKFATPFEGENDEIREQRLMVKEFFEEMRAGGLDAAGGHAIPVAYTGARHLMLDLALMSLRVFARAARERGDALEARIAVLEASAEQVLSRGLFFSGTHQRSLGYERGSAVSFQGSLWVAIENVAAGEVPGASPSWQLAVKRGRDARDAPSLSGEAA